MNDPLDRAYWEDRYTTHADGWDLGAPSTPLKTFIDGLEDKDLRILIPGCGRAWEGQYLHERGFRNVWLMDLTGWPFKELEERCPGFPKEHLLTGDFFAHTGQYDLIIEQTFFCALDRTLRDRYVEKMHELLAPGGRLAGVLFDDPAPGKDPLGPPFGGSRAEYMERFGKRFLDLRIDACYNSIPPRAGREVWLLAVKERDTPYLPVDCALHDAYLAWATQRVPVRIEHLAPNGDLLEHEGVIKDVSTDPDRSEWMTLGDGTRIRLDRIKRSSP